MITMLDEVLPLRPQRMYDAYCFIFTIYRVVLTKK